MKDQLPNNQYDCSCKDGEKCEPHDLAGINRRTFIRHTAIGASMLAWPTMPLFAGPFDENDYLKYIPADKKLHPEWIESLFERGQKEIYSDPAALQHIGMPIGGLFAGTVYLSGDGRLWLWDIFNRDQEGIQPREVDLNGKNIRTRDGANFVEPAKSISPFKIGFEVVIGADAWPLDSSGFDNIAFDGRYPMATITYQDATCPVDIMLTAFSPFIPLNANDSSLPATMLNYRVVNKSANQIEGHIKAFIENPICSDTGHEARGRLKNSRVIGKNIAGILCEAIPLPNEKGKARLDILFDDFESGSYSNWEVSGVAFGQKPINREDVPDYQGALGGEGKFLVNSHASAPGENVTEKDQKTGTLTSHEFLIERKYIQFYVGGGAHKNKTCVNLLVDNELVATLTGSNNNAMALSGFEVSKWEGKLARIQIVDEVSGGWGNIGIDHIVFTDSPPKSQDLNELRDFGTFCLSLLNPLNAQIITDPNDWQAKTISSRDMSERPVSEIHTVFSLKPNEEEDHRFGTTWHFPNFYGRDFGGEKVGHHYASRFSSALDVAKYIAKHESHLLVTTKKWVDNWYNSSLPYWLLDRTMANTSTLATTTCYRHQDGRFWAWEGIGCCTGTCTHVWHYAQALGRLFPEIERDQRERIDFGMALKVNGEIGYRTLLDTAMGPAFDGQCGRILGAYREHLMSANSDFLKRNWTAIKKAVLYMIDQDFNLDGILEGAQPNTLDAAWYGKISFISSLYISALTAGGKMALEMGDDKFADICAQIAKKGSENILELFNDEFFIQLEDLDHQDVIGVGKGCYIDQIFGQTWAHWLGLGHLFDREKQLKALRSLYRYNFVPDVGPFRKHFEAGRWYAMAGDGGLLMCTWPKGGKRDKWEDQWQFMYFNECMSGFEWQAAAHMIYEGIDNPDILQNGLAIGRAIHDRYNAKLRNPYNEIECSDHYARAMASYGVFQAVCGFHYHGPDGILQFDPRLHPEDFRSAFVCAEGWGSYAQKTEPNGADFSFEIQYGKLILNEILLRIPARLNNKSTTLIVAGVTCASKSQLLDNGLTRFTFGKIELHEGQSLNLTVA